MLSNILKNINKNIFNNFLIAKSRHTSTHLFQKLPSLAPAPAPKSQNAPMLHRFTFVFCILFQANVTRHEIFSIAYVYQGLETSNPSPNLIHKKFKNSKTNSKHIWLYINCHTIFVPKLY